MTLARYLFAVGLAGLLGPLSLGTSGKTASAGAWGFDDGLLGASCQDYDLATGLAWRNPAGDWRDAAGKPQGDAPFGSISLGPKTALTQVEFDVSALVRRSLDNGEDPAILIRSLAAGRGFATFNSREVADPSLRPLLILTSAAGAKREFPAVADTYVACSSHKSLGERDVLQAGPGVNILVRFARITRTDPSFQLKKAVVRLTLVRRPSRKGSFGAFALDPPIEHDATSQPGIAARYDDLRALARDPAVVFTEDFESDAWTAHWSKVERAPTVTQTGTNTLLKFEPFDGKALEVEIPKGKKLGLNVTYDFRDKLGSEPDEIYFRYYLRLADDWHPTVSGGKLPGIAGTYNRAGWGGRKPDGTNGWSMRGGFSKEIPEHRPLGGDTPIGTYAYHVDQEGKYGEFWHWSQGRPTALERNRWYCIEQYFHVNTPGKNDGVMMAWVDGVKLFSRSNIRVRDVDSLHIEQVWMNVYHGGTAAAPQDLHLFIDDVVIARRYIGPQASDLSQEQKTAARR